MPTLTVIFGFTLVGLGILMVVTPAPGLLVITLGLSLLAREYEWARRWLDNLSSSLRRLHHR